MMRRIFRISTRMRKMLPARRIDLGRIKRICIFKIGAIGDVLMSTPMVHALRQRFPRAKIDYWTGRWSAQVLHGNRDLDAVTAFDDAAFYNKRPGLAIRLARQIASRRYDLMFILDKHWSLGTFGKLCSVPVRIGFDREGEGFGHTIAVPYLPVKHEVDYYLDLAYAVGAKKVVQPKLELALSPADKRFALQFFRKHKLNPKQTIAVIPGGAKNPGQDMAMRRWPAERFAAVARALAQEGWQILIAGKSPGDDDAVQPMLKAVPNAVNAVGDLTLQQSSALLRSCRLAICNDSGPMHLAAAVGTPTVSVFGATDPHRKAPRGRQHLWVWNPVDCVKAEVYGRYDEPHLIANILKVQPRHVLAAVRKLLR